MVEGADEVLSPVKSSHRVCEDHFYTGRPNPTNIHPDYAPSILPWNGNHRPRTEEERDEFEERMEDIREQVKAIIDVSAVRGIMGTLNRF